MTQIKVHCGNIEGLGDYRYVTVAFNPINSRNIVLTKHAHLKFAVKAMKNMGRPCKIYSTEQCEFVQA